MAKLKLLLAELKARKARYEAETKAYLSDFEVGWKMGSEDELDNVITEIEKLIAQEGDGK